MSKDWDVTDRDADSISAYLDGELDDVKARRLAALVARDPAARQLASDFAWGDSLVRAAFDQPSRRPPPKFLVQSIDQARTAARTNRWMARAAVPIAAGLVTLAIGLGAGFFLASERIDRQLARMETQRLENRRALEAVVSRALENHLSGTRVGWENPVAGARGTVTPLRTFRSTENKWCREYARRIEEPTGIETLRAIACRQADGRWNTRVHIVGDL